MFKLEDFENGMVVELKCGDKRLFWEGNFIDKNGYIPVSLYNKELVNTDTFDGRDDIVRIYESKHVTHFNAFFADKHLTEIWSRDDLSKYKNQHKELLDDIDRLMIAISVRKTEHSKIAHDEKISKPSFIDLDWCYEQLYHLKRLHKF